jgi:autotransporter-associated beta strand protein
LTARFNTNSTGGAGTITGVITANDTAIFGAGTDATGAYTVTVSGTRSAAQINVEEGSPTFTGGTLAVGVFDVSSGASANVASTLSGGPSSSVKKQNAGTLTLSGTQSYTGGTTVLGGKLIMNRLHANNPVTITGGTLQIADSSPTVPAHPSGNNAAVSRPGSMISITQIAGVYQGALDLGNNDLIIDYVSGSPAAQVENMVRSGFNFGDWLGKGITSSTAANPLSNGNYALAVAENSALVIPFGNGTTGPLFSGQSVDATTVLVKFTHRVDLDLDGVVSGNDAAVFNGAFSEGDSGATWATGDLDYDGGWSSNDAAIFNSFYDESLASLPEPTVAGIVGLVAVWSCARRRSRC